ncbi:hypothetical protein Q7P35_009543 [Cladosporium inversicolor]
MMKTALLATIGAAVTSAQLLDISGLLAGLGPAPDGDSRFTTFTSAGPNDVRSPCPGLNALANHGFIHHDGRDMTIPHLLEGLAAGLNIGPDFTVAVGGLGLFSSPDPLGGSFDLNDLDQHNFPIEHDASLSREDAYFGNDYSFNSGIWNQTRSFFKNGKTALLPAALAIANRTADSKKRNPEFVYGLQQFILRYGEMTLAIETMGGGDLTGVARLDWVNQLFTQEKLPYNLGWRPRAEPITLPSIGQMIVEIFAVSPEKFSEAGTITADSYKDVLVALSGGSEALNNITSGLASAVGLL